MTLKELMDKAAILPLLFYPEDDENAPAITNEDGVVFFTEGDAPDDEREATAALMVHCTNTYMDLVKTLERICPDEHTFNSGIGAKEVRRILAKAQNIPSGEKEEK